jgi:hypothetical protein
MVVTGGGDAHEAEVSDFRSIPEWLGTPHAL